MIIYIGRQSNQMQMGLGSEPMSMGSQEVKPGIYRVFADLNIDGKLIKTDYTVKVE